MLYTVTNSGLQNGRPTSIGANSISIDNRASHTFTVDNFTTETTPAYSDPENDPLSYIEILTLPSGTGQLLVNSNPVSVGSVIPAGQISTGNLTYVAADQDALYQSSFTFDCADTGSNSLSGLGTGIITMNVAQAINLPPDVVGNYVVTLDHGLSYTFSSSDFTTGTTPAYNDPEGDAPSSIKILDLPANGNLKFNGSNVTANQIVTVSEIDAGYLIYEPDLNETDLQSLSFNFSVTDTGGSGIYTE